MLGVLFFIALAGILNLLGAPGFKQGDGGKNLQWDNLWTGTRLEANGFVIALYNVIWYALNTAERIRFNLGFQVFRWLSERQLCAFRSS